MDYKNLKEVVNPPKKWKEGLDASEKLVNILKKKPSSYVKKPSKKVAELTKNVIAGAKTDEEKLYKISEWIVEHIGYDADMYEKVLNEMRGKGYRDFRYDAVKWITDPDGVLDNGYTVCAGYSMLTREMCWAAGIPAVYVSGEIPNGASKILHAWNAVYVNGRWAFIDNTWNDSDYNSQWRSAVHTETNAWMDEHALTYEAYLANKELQEAYTWEEVQGMMKQQGEQESFANYHPYFIETSTALFAADHIPHSFDETEIKK